MKDTLEEKIGIMQKVNKAVRDYSTAGIMMMALASACGGDGQPDPCRSNSDCESGYTCQECSRCGETYSCCRAEHSYPLTTSFEESQPICSQEENE